MRLESRSWRENIHPDDLAILKELEDLVGPFELQGEEMDANWDIHYHYGMDAGPGLKLDHHNHITAISLSGYPIKDLHEIVCLVKKLPRLVELYVGNTGIVDLTPISDLPRLQKLEITLNDIIDLTPLSSLSSLLNLDMLATGVKDLEPLSGLLTLEYLDAENNKFTDLTPLASLTRLQVLLLGENDLHDVRPLADLIALKKLELYDTLIQDIKPLSPLKKLQILDLSNTPIDDFSPLESFEFLQKLNLSFTNISDLTLLANTKRLQKLSVNYTPVKSLSSLSNNGELIRISARNCSISYFDEQLLPHLPALEELELAGNPIVNIPAAITGLENCLDDLKSFFKDRNHAQIAAYESKIILIGNGRVGKTSLVKRWLDNTFDAEEPSTHAIQLRSWLLPELAQQVELQHIRLNIWDFGGQDIYHATHRSFMRTEAVFLLVWDAQTENTPEQEETLPGGKAIKYKNYPLEHWLSYIKVLSNNSPVIVVQTHRNRDKQKINVLTQAQQIEYNVKGMLAVENSTAIVNGYEALKERIQEIVVEQIQQTCTTLPLSWINVRNAIAQLHEIQQVKQLPVSTFEALCHKEKLDQRSTHTLLYYFHNTGVLFHRLGLFNNQIVIDQKWAIDAIYILFDRKGYFARLHQQGRFTGADIQEYWQQYTPAEQKLFISFMQQCEICFEVNLHLNKSFDEKVFIAPQLLPETPPLSVQALRRHGDGLYYKYRHRFLHSAIIQRFIVRTSNLASENDRWQSGVVLSTDEGIALVEAFPKLNEIVIRLDSIDQKSLLNKIRNEMKEINSVETEIVEAVSLDGTNFVNLERLKKHPAGNASTEAENGNWVNVDKLRIFLNLPKDEVFQKSGDGKPARNKRKAIPRPLLKELQEEIDGKCPFCINTEVQVFEVHHLDGDSSNNSKSNLLMLCGHCHNKITYKYISTEEVYNKKKQLSSQ